MLHLPGARGTLICAPESGAVSSYSRSAVEVSTGIGSRPPRNRSYGLSSMERRYHGGSLVWNRRPKSTSVNQSEKFCHVAELLPLLLPGVIAADAPEMTFEIAAGEVAAVGFIF